MKNKAKYSKKLTLKNRVYWCWLCDSRNVKWDGKVFACKECGATHKTVLEVVLAKSK